MNGVFIAIRMVLTAFACHAILNPAARRRLKTVPAGFAGMHRQCQALNRAPINRGVDRLEPGIAAMPWVQKRLSQTQLTGSHG